MTNPLKASKRNKVLLTAEEITRWHVCSVVAGGITTHPTLTEVEQIITELGLRKDENKRVDPIPVRLEYERRHQNDDMEERKVA